MRTMKDITTKEKVVFLFLLVLISSVAMVAGMKMAFSNTLIFLIVIFLIYKLIKSKLGKKSDGKDKPDSMKPSLDDNLSKNITKIHHAKKISASIQTFWTLGFVFLAFGTLLFYWFQIRPANIKHACSWTKEYVGGEPARPAMSEKEARSKGLLKDCSPRPLDTSNSASGNFLNSLFTPEALAICEKENQNLSLCIARQSQRFPLRNVKGKQLMKNTNFA